MSEPCRPRTPGAPPPGQEQHARPSLPWLEIAEVLGWPGEWRRTPSEEREREGVPERI